MSGNPAFAEYVTSGAFTLTLSRHQISALAMCVGGDPLLFDGTASALLRKGLVTQVAVPREFGEEGVEFRPTLAGLLALQLLAEAGLGNQSNAIAVELELLRGQLETARRETIDARERAWSCATRQDEAQAELETFRRELEYRREAMKPGSVRLRGEDGTPWPVRQGIVRRRDKHPLSTDAELRAGLGPKPEAPAC